MKTNLDEMLAFVSVVDSGSISAAAVQLEQTASGVSRALSRLEEKLAVTLLRRTTRRLELTEEGEAFLAQARRILRQLGGSRGADGVAAAGAGRALASQYRVAVHAACARAADW